MRSAPCFEKTFYPSCYIPPSGFYQAYSFKLAPVHFPPYRGKSQELAPVHSPLHYGSLNYPVHSIPYWGGFKNYVSIFLLSLNINISYISVYDQELFCERVPPGRIPNAQQDIGLIDIVPLEKIRDKN
jgi:hypothetical protein